MKSEIAVDCFNPCSILTRMERERIFSSTIPFEGAQRGGHMQRRSLTNDLSRRRRRWRMAKNHNPANNEGLMSSTALDTVQGGVSLDLLTDSPEASGKG